MPPLWRIGTFSSYPPPGDPLAQIRLGTKRLLGAVPDVFVARPALDLREPATPLCGGTSVGGISRVGGSDVDVAMGVGVSVRTGAAAALAGAGAAARSD